MNFSKIAENTFFTEHLWATTSKQVTVPLQCLQTAKSLISSCRRTGETILSNYCQNPKITVTLHYFHYNSHQHYNYYHFHYHCKMHFHRLKILLTILLNVFFLPVFIFLLFHYTFRSFIILYFSEFFDKKWEI